MQVKVLIENDFIKVTRNTWSKGEVFPKHTHKEFHKLLIVESGKVRVRTWRDNQEKSTILSSGEGIEIPAEVFRQTIVLEDTIAYKVYYKDIEIFKNDRDIRTRLLTHMTSVYNPHSIKK